MGRLRNDSVLEIRAQHRYIQNRYGKNARKRHLTDIDFEGIPSQKKDISNSVLLRYLEHYRRL